MCFTCLRTVDVAFLFAVDPGLRGSVAANDESPDLLLQRVRKTAIHEAPAVGEGMDLRFDNASGVADGALLVRDRIVHLVAFAMAELSLRGSDRVYRRR